MIISIVIMYYNVILIAKNAIILTYILYTVYTIHLLLRVYKCIQIVYRV